MLCKRNLHPHSPLWEGLGLLTHIYSSYDFVLRNISIYSSYDFVLRNISHGKYVDFTGVLNQTNTAQFVCNFSTLVGFGPMRLLPNSLAQLWLHGLALCFPPLPDSMKQSNYKTAFKNYSKQLSKSSRKVKCMCSNVSNVISSKYISSWSPCSKAALSWPTGMRIAK